MKTNEHLQDKLWTQVGEEVARKEYSPGPMAKAVAESNGNRDLVQSLYIKFRREELLRQMERESQQQEIQRREQQEVERKRINEEARIKKLQRNGDITTQAWSCAACGFNGFLNIKTRGSLFVFIILLFLGLVPGIIYAIAHNNYRGVCPHCGAVVIRKWKTGD